MKTKRNLLLLCVFAMGIGGGLRAQVTIGSAENPKDGAILDLNNGAQGGLILSNVNLTDPGIIPDNFPGMNEPDLDMDAVKEQLKGAMIYNMDANTCVGIHVWDGNHWARIAPSREYTGDPLKGPLRIASNTTDAVGGDNIEFTVDTQAKTYTWYINKDDEGYKYLGSTTEPKLLTKIPAGLINVKVIADNCQILEESNEVNLKPETFSPSFGSIEGGNIIYLYGDFPYAATGDYISTGLAAHYDGINNTGDGDKMHDNEATGWTDLQFANTIPLKVVGDATGSGWQSNGYKFASTTYFYQSSIPDNFSKGTEKRTLEIVFKTPDNYPYEAGKGLTSIPYLFDYGGSGSSGEHSGVAYNYGLNRFYPMVGGGASYSWGASFNATTHPELIPLTEASKLNTSTFVYTTSLTNSGSRAYLNGIDITGYRDSGTSSLQTASSGEFYIGNQTYNSNNNQVAVGFTISSIRIYNETLTPAQVAHNAELDQKRYLSLPTVKIGDDYCYDVVVLSPNSLMCKVPPGTEGPANVEITSGGKTLPILQNAYKYVATTEFYIKNIVPIIGIAYKSGQPLKLEGNKLDEINATGGIKVGTEDCPIISQSKTECTCTLPDNIPAGEVDITITKGATIYRFAKVFEYITK